MANTLHNKTFWLRNVEPNHVRNKENISRTCRSGSLVKISTLKWFCFL